jgi:hypothetical protein
MAYVADATPGTVGAIVFGVAAAATLIGGMIFPPKTSIQQLRWFFLMGPFFLKCFGYLAVSLGQAYYGTQNIQWGLQAISALSHWMLAANLSYGVFVEAGARWSPPGLTLLAFLALAVAPFYTAWGFWAWFTVACILCLLLTIVVMLSGLQLDAIRDYMSKTACEREKAEVVFKWYGLLYRILFVIIICLYKLAVALGEPAGANLGKGVYSFYFWSYLVIDVVAHVIFAPLMYYFLKPAAELTGSGAGALASLVVDEAHKADSINGGNNGGARHRGTSAYRG